MARPHKQRDVQRSSHLRVRLTAPELAQIQERASALGMGRSDYVRTRLLGGRLTVSRIARADPALILELNKIGVNLNQLTRTANGVGRVPPDLDRLCRRIEQFLIKSIGPEIDRGANDC